MRFRSGRRRTVRCTIAAVLAALAATWTASLFGYLAYFCGTGGPVVSVAYGVIALGPRYGVRQGLLTGWDCGWYKAGGRTKIIWRPTLDLGATGPVIIYVPLWMPAMAVGGAGAWRLYADRVRPRGVCARCRYSRAGLAPDAVCPECGTAPVS